MSKDKTIVELAKDRFRLASEYYTDSREKSKKDFEFAFGDSDNMYQYDEHNRVKIGKPRFTVNKAAQHCNQVINNMRMMRPDVDIIPSGLSSHKKTADILSGMIRSINASCNADFVYDKVAEDCTIGGEGFYYIDADYESDTSFNQVLKVYYSSPFHTFIDPSATELDKCDAEWGFVFQKMNKERCKREYGDKYDTDTWELEDDWVSEDEVMVAIYWHCEYKKAKLLMLDSGQAVYEDQYDGFSPIKMAGDKPQMREVYKKEWYRCVLLGGADEPVEKTRWLGNYFPIVEVIGKEFVNDGKMMRKGMLRDLKDGNVIYNYAVSASVEGAYLSNNIPYMIAEEALPGADAHRKQWDMANQSSAAYLVYKSRDDQGNAVPTPQRQDGHINNNGYMSLAQMAVDAMKEASGQHGATFGMNTNETSGRAINARKEQGELATFHFPDNQIRGRHYGTKVLLDAIPAYYDTPRVIRMLGVDGKETKAVIDVDMQEPINEDVNSYEFTDDDIEAAFNPLIGLYDIVIRPGPSYATQREAGAERMMQLVQSYPPLMDRAGNMILKMQDFPMADELAEQFEKSMPPELQPEKEGEAPIPPEVQAQQQQMQQQMEQMQMQIEQMGQALNNASKQMDEKEAEVSQKDVAIQKAELALIQEKKARLQGEMDAIMNIKSKPQGIEGQEESQDIEILPVISEMLDQVSEETQRDISALALTIKESNEQLASMLAELMKPKNATITITSPSGGVYTGTKIEEV